MTIDDDDWGTRLLHTWRRLECACDVVFFSVGSSVHWGAKNGGSGCLVAGNALRRARGCAEEEGALTWREGQGGGAEI